MKSSTFEEETAGDLFYLRNKKITVMHLNSCAL